jgi:hypothetical protein
MGAQPIVSSPESPTNSGVKTRPRAGSDRVAPTMANSLAPTLKTRKRERIAPAMGKPDDLILKKKSSGPEHEPWQSL